MKNFSIQIHRQLWRVVFTDDMPADDDGRRNNDGLCDYGAKKIFIRKSLTNQDMLDTVAHEITHAFFPNMAHKSVSMFGNLLARVLWKLDYRESKR
jgi:hypothetical protein